MEELQQDLTNWSLASDAKLLQYLQTYSSDLVNQTSTFVSKVDELAFTTAEAEVSLRNTFNEFLMLGNTQFIENRVYDDDDEDEDAESQAAIEKDKEALLNVDPLTHMKDAFNLGQGAFKYFYLENSDHERVEDIYNIRPLPYVFGTKLYLESPDGGLGGAETYSQIEDNPVNPSAPYSDRNDEYDEQERLNENYQIANDDNNYEDFNHRAAPPPPPRTAPPPPPPSFGQSNDDYGEEENEENAEYSHGKVISYVNEDGQMQHPSGRPAPPPPSGSIKDMLNAQISARTGGSVSDGTETTNNNVSSPNKPINSKSIDEEDPDEAEEDGDLFATQDDPYSLFGGGNTSFRASISINKKSNARDALKDLFGDAIMKNDSSDTFSTSGSKRRTSFSSLFGDGNDDSLFDDVTETKPAVITPVINNNNKVEEEPKPVLPPKTVTNDLFGDESIVIDRKSVSVNKPADTSSKSTMRKMDASELFGSGLFDDDEDDKDILSNSKKSVDKSLLDNSNNSNNNTATISISTTATKSANTNIDRSSRFASLFGDDNDDNPLFGEEVSFVSKNNKSAAAKPSIASTNAKKANLSSLFGDDDDVLFLSKPNAIKPDNSISNNQKPNVDKVEPTKQIIPNKAKASSLFDDDDGNDSFLSKKEVVNVTTTAAISVPTRIVESKPSTTATSSSTAPMSSSVTSKKSIFDDDDDDEIVKAPASKSVSTTKAEPIPSKLTSTTTGSSAKKKSIFDDDDDDAPVIKTSSTAAITTSSSTVKTETAVPVSNVTTSSSATKKKSIFDDDDDDDDTIIAPTRPKEAQTPSSSNTKNTTSINAKKSSIFDDEDDNNEDLFKKKVPVSQPIITTSSIVIDNSPSTIINENKNTVANASPQIKSKIPAGGFALPLPPRPPVVDDDNNDDDEYLSNQRPSIISRLSYSERMSTEEDTHRKAPYGGISIPIPPRRPQSQSFSNSENNSNNNDSTDSIVTKPIEKLESITPESIETTTNTTTNNNNNSTSKPVSSGLASRMAGLDPSKMIMPGQAMPAKFIHKETDDDTLHGSNNNNNNNNGTNNFDPTTAALNRATVTGKTRRAPTKKSFNPLEETTENDLFGSSKSNPVKATPLFSDGNDVSTSALSNKTTSSSLLFEENNSNLNNNPKTISEPPSNISKNKGLFDDDNTNDIFGSSKAITSTSDYKSSSSAIIATATTTTTTSEGLFVNNNEASNLNSKPNATSEPALVIPKNKGLFDDDDNINDVFGSKKIVSSSIPTSDNKPTSSATPTITGNKSINNGLFGNDDNNDNKKEEKNSISPIKNDNNSILNSKSSGDPLKSNKMSSLFGDDEDGSSGLFGSKPVVAAAVSVPAMKKMSNGGLFGDDDDIFGSKKTVSATNIKPETSPVTKKMSSLFGDDDDGGLFGAKPAPVTKPAVVPKPKISSLFGDDDDPLFGSSKKTSSSKGLFDD
eukprot:gene13307-17829_t